MELPSAVWLWRQSATAIRAGGERMATTKKKGGGSNGAALMQAPAGLKAGSSGGDVALLQDYLTRFGYLATPPSKDAGRMAELDLRPAAAPGEFDEATEEALRQFQERAGLPVTGKLDEETQGKMQQPRCGNPDITPLTNPTILSLVEPEAAGFVATGGRWPTQTPRYGVQAAAVGRPAGRSRAPWDSPGVQPLGGVDRPQLPRGSARERAGDHHPLRLRRPRRRQRVRRAERHPRPRLLPAGAAELPAADSGRH